MCRVDGHAFIYIHIFFQIVCGITGLVMGMVAIIEEKGKMNLGIAIPAGVLTVVAAGVYG